MSALMVVAAVVSQHPRLDSARPVAPDTVRAKRVAHQNVEARMWEDPFNVVAQYRKRKADEAALEGRVGHRFAESPPAILPPDDAHVLDPKFKNRLTGWLGSLACDEGYKAPVRLLMPMVMGGSGEEDAEMRRRTRYAVTSGLMNAGYEPDSASAVGYAYIPAELRSHATVDDVPEILPFEWFGRSLGEGMGREWILVVWLDDSKFFSAPVAQVRRVVDLLTPRCADGAIPPYEPTVLGPVDSDGLGRVMGELQREAEKDAKDGMRGARTKVSFVSASATSESLGKQSKSRFYFETPSGDTVVSRVIGPDAALMRSLADELKKRMQYFSAGVDKSPAVVVIGEHDTGYGRDFSRDLPKLLKAQGVEVQGFDYLREIDGGRGSPRKPPKADEGDPDTGASKGGGRDGPAAKAQGTSQIDYLERMVHDVELYAKEKKKHIVGVAIFGNDVFDKMLIMRALRPAFPGAVFMTTDLDARLFDAGEGRYTRNLIVASNFGFSLDRSIQGGAAPFRDGYQTASYFAAWMYAGKCARPVLARFSNSPAKPEWLETPLVFEIGRSRPVPLVAVDPGAHPVDLSSCQGWAEDVNQEKRKRASVQAAQEPAKMPRAQILLLGFALAALVLLLRRWTGWYPVRYEGNAEASQTLNAPELIAMARELAAQVRSGTPGMAKDLWTLIREIGKGLLRVSVPLFAGALLVWLLVAVLKACDAPSIAFMGTGLLLAVVATIGIWQMQQAIVAGNEQRAIVAAALVAPSVLLLVWCASAAVVPNDEPFAWAEGVSVWPTQIVRTFAAVFGLYAIWNMSAANMNSMMRISIRYALLGDQDLRRKDGRKAMAKLWRNYAGSRSIRVAITIGVALGYFAACVWLMRALEAAPGIPMSGDHVPEVAMLLGFDIFLGVVLLIRMMYTCRSFMIDILRPALKATPWFPETCVTNFMVTHNLSAAKGEGPAARLSRFVDCCLTVELAAERSRALVSLIYLPFIMFGLLVVARSAVFDNWDTPLGLAIVLGLPFAAVIAFMGWLSYRTTVFHQRLIHEAEHLLIGLRAEEGVSGERNWQLERLFEKLREEKRGSFQNIFLQPMFRALLVPLGGISGFEILENLLLNR